MCRPPHTLCDGRRRKRPTGAGGEDPKTIARKSDARAALDIPCGDAGVSWTSLKHLLIAVSVSIVVVAIALVCDLRVVVPIMGYKKSVDRAAAQRFARGDNDMKNSTQPSDLAEV